MPNFWQLSTRSIHNIQQFPSIKLIFGQNSHLILYASLENLKTHIAYFSIISLSTPVKIFFCLKAKVLMCDLHNEVALIRKPFISQKVVKEWRWASYLNSRGIHYKHCFFIGIYFYKNGWYISSFFALSIKNFPKDGFFLHDHPLLCKNNK